MWKVGRAAYCTQFRVGRSVCEHRARGSKPLPSISTPTWWEGVVVSILAKHVEFVKAHVAVQEKLARKFAPDSKYHNPGRYQLHLGNVDHFSELLSDIELANTELDEADSRPRTAHRGPVQLQLLPQDLEGLPSELLEELSVQSVDKLEMAIFAAFNDAGGTMSLDRILINIYRKTGEVHKRTAITAKLYRMIQKGILYSVPSRKGWYSLSEMSEEDATALFGSAGA
jgi:hypothetical protein